MDDIVILAGGKADPSLQELTGVTHRADVPFHGLTLLERTVAAVAPLAGRTIVVGGSEATVVPEGSIRVEGGQNFIDSLGRALEKVTSNRFLLCTVDLPFLTTESLNAFLSACEGEYGLFYPIVSAEACRNAFPTVSRTTLKLREGEFTGGNIALIHTDEMRRGLTTMQKAYDARKSPLKLAQIVGFDTLGRVALGKLVPASLTIATVEAKVGRFLGFPVKAVVTQDAAIGTDVDDAAQYQALLQLQTPQN